MLRRRPTPLALAAVLLPALVPGGGVSAQQVTLDEGRFALFVGDRPAGEEAFSIYRVGMGRDARILATATVSFDGLEMRPALEARPDFTVTTYENTLSGRRSAELSVVLNGGRYVSRMRSPEGEVQREYRATPRSAILESGVSHQYYFVARFVDEGAGPVAVLAPAEGRQARLEVGSSRTEPFRFGDESIEARHLRLEGGDGVHDVWVDDQGRILRVEIPSRDFRAERRPDEG